MPKTERQKNKILAVYLILTAAGYQVSDNMKRIVENIEKEKTAAYVAAR